MNQTDDSESKSKPLSLRDYFQSQQAQDDWKAQIKRQNEAPSKAFPGWNPSMGIPPQLQEHIEISLFGRILREEERRAGKLMPLGEEPE